MTYDNEKIGNLIREERKKLKLTQDELGRMLYISGKQISNYEKGKPLPPLETLLKMAEIFHCELGFLLGEESYRDRSKLNTAICKSLGLTGKAVDALQSAAQNGLKQELIERQNAISSFFESHHFGNFIECLIEVISINNRLKLTGDSAYKDLAERFGEESIEKAVGFMLAKGVNISVPMAEQSREELIEAEKALDAYIEKNRNDEYALKVARYELREAFEALVGSLLTS